jgi:hypothetical protein
MTRQERIERSLRCFAREELEGFARHVQGDAVAVQTGGINRVTVASCPQCQDFLDRFRHTYQLLGAV